MLEQDYLMRIFLQFAEILRRSWFKARDEHDPKAAADMLENAVGDAVDIDEEGRLGVRTDSGEEHVFTGEASVHGIYGAV